MDVAVIMGSKSDWETMSCCADQLTEFGIEFEAKVVSAHRTPEWMVEYATTAQSRGIKVIIAAAGGAAHLPGMVSALTPLPVLGVPIKSRTLNGIDSLLSIVQMPAGVPTATFAIGEAGAKNAAIFAARLLAATDTQLAEKVRKQMDDQREKVLSDCDLGGFIGKDKPGGGNDGGQTT